jgi:ribonuclease BN (tRNA processing enzyme)
MAAGAGIGTAILPALGGSGGLRAQTPPPPQPPAPPASPPSGSLLVLLGTQGGPTVNLGRGEAASALIVDGRPYLVDCGYGTLRALVQAGLRLVDVGAVWLTHLHNDHTADVAALLSHQWTGSRRDPTTVYGPPGTQALVRGALAFFAGDVEIRSVDEGRTARPEALFTGQDIRATTAPVQVFKDDRVTAHAIENMHYPETAKARMAHRSLAFRFDMADRSIVFSGDTAPSSNLVELARNADILVCEAVDVARHRQLMADAAAAGPGASIARHVAETHSTTEEVGRMAAAARVKTVVLSHLLPGSNPVPGEIPDTAYIAGVRRFFDGEVIVGRDQMKL